MPHRLEIALKSDLPDAEGEGLRQKAKDYFGLHLETVRNVSIVTLDADLSEDQLGRIREEIFTNPVIQVSSYDPLPIDFDWTIWVGFRPGVRDNPGATAVEAVEDLLGIHFGKDDAVYTSQRYCILGDGLSIEAMDRLAGELLANDIIQQWKIFERADWDPAVGIGWIIPRVILNHTPTVSAITVASDEALRKAQEQRPDLICLDIMLPGLDGYSTLMKLRGDPRTKDIPVFIVSGESGDIHRDISRTFGAVEFISKPFDIKEILQKAAKILENHD